MGNDRFSYPCYSVNNKIDVVRILQGLIQRFSRLVVAEFCIQIKLKALLIVRELTVVNTTFVSWEESSNVFYWDMIKYLKVTIRVTNIREILKFAGH